MFRRLTDHLEETLHELELLCIEPCAIVEGEEIEVYIATETPPSSAWEKVAVDWEEEWKKNSDVEALPFKMTYGGGFGDFSHPTTQLMMQELSHFEEEIVVDVGCGSGILTLQALFNGAKKVYALDIDPEAIRHTKANLALNHYEAEFTLPKLGQKALVLMNMIRKEQEAAWDSIKDRIFLKSRIITSGILEEERPLYLQWAEKEGLHLERESSLSGWLSFVFTLS